MENKINIFKTYDPSTMEFLGQGSGGTVNSIRKYNNVEKFAIKIMQTPWEYIHESNKEEL